MKKLLFILLLFSLSITVVKSQNLTIASFNLRGDGSGDVGNLWTDRKFLVVDQIQKYKFDVVALEETTVNMAAYLRTTISRFDTLGFVSSTGTGMLYDKNKLDLLDHGHFWLSPTPNSETIGWDAKFKRVCVWAKFKDKTTGYEFFTFGTHFDHVGTTARTNSVALVLSKINELAGTTPTIFMGDLNISQWDPNYITLNNSGVLKDCFNLANLNHERERGTGNGFDATRRERTRVDHMFLTNTLQAYEYDVIVDLYNGKTASDHYSIMAKIGAKNNNYGDLYRQFPEDFENPAPLKTSYTSGDVTLKTGTWLFNNAIIGGSIQNDSHTSGDASVRLINNNTTSAFLQMKFDVTDGASKIIINHSTYNGDNKARWQLEYSTNQGLTWASTGQIVVTNRYSKQQAVFVVDIPRNVRFRINKLGNATGNSGRLCIDDFTIYKRKNPATEKKNVQLLGWQFATPASTGVEANANASFVHSSLNTSTLTRGAGLRTTNGSSSISLARGFAAAATIATTSAATDTALAMSNNLYLQFTVKPKAMQKVSLATLDARLMVTDTSMKVWYWKYSLDGVNFKFLAKPYEYSSALPTAQNTINLAAYPALQNLTSDKTVYFRLYVNGLDAADEIFGFGTSMASTANDFVLALNGTVETAPMMAKLVAWQFGTPATTGGETSKTASAVNAAVTAGDLVRGAGLSTTNSYYPTPYLLARAFGSVTSIASAATLADTTVAVANAMYFGFSVKVKANYKVSLSSVDYKLRISSAGAKVWYWKYSLDSVTFKSVANPLVLQTLTDTEGNIQPQIDLSTITELQNIPAGTTVYFRLYAHGGNNTSGTTSLGRSAASTADDYSLNVNGTATSIPTSTKLVAWQFATPATTGGETSSTASLVHSAITAGQFERGAGLKAIDNTSGTALVLSRAFVSVTAIASSANVIDTAIAVHNDMYFGYNITVKSGYKASLSTLNYKIRISGGGAKVWYWKYSLDGVNFEKITNPIVLVTATDTEGETQPSIDLSTISALQNLPAGKTVYFRLYTNGSNTSTGTTAIGRSTASTSNDYAISIDGVTEVVAAPEKMLAWQFGNPQKAGNETSITATTINNAVTATGLIRGAGLTATTLSRSIVALTSITSSTDVADTVTAVANNMYFAFSMTVKAGKTVHLKGLAYKVRISGGGAKVWYWKYSLNGTSFFEVENPATLTDATDGEGAFLPPIDLTSIPALQNIPSGTTVYFRLYTNGSNTSTGSSAIGRSATSSTEDVLWLTGNAEAETMGVELVAFNGKNNGEQVELNWQTSSEINNSYFDILQVKQNKEPLSIGKVTGSGASASLKTYHFTDSRPSVGTNYYQLRQVDFNGTATLSPVIAVKSIFAEDDFKMSAQPNQLILFIKSANAVESQFTLTDLLGRTILSKKLKLEAGHHTFTLDVNLQTGVYIGSITKLGSEKVSKKIIY